MNYRQGAMLGREAGNFLIAYDLTTQKQELFLKDFVQSDSQ